MSRDLMIVRTEDLLLNPTNRVPIALCLDASGSMSGQPMQELNQGVRLFFERFTQTRLRGLVPRSRSSPSPIRPKPSSTSRA